VSGRGIKAPGYAAEAPAASPFALAPPDPEPLPRLTRVALEWDGTNWAEIDPANGLVLDFGTEGKTIDD